MKKPFVTNDAIDCIEPEAAVLKSRPSLMREEDRLADPRVTLQFNCECGQSL